MKIFNNTRALGLLFVLFISTSLIAQDTTQQITTGRFNSAVSQKKPYVILISIDGLRSDFVEKFNAKSLQAYVK